MPRSWQRQPRRWRIRETPLIVVGHGHAGTTAPLCRLGDLASEAAADMLSLRASGCSPILAELARQVAAACRRKARRARQKMIERLFFDGIHAESRRATVASEHHLPTLAGAHETQAALPSPRRQKRGHSSQTTWSAPSRRKYRVATGPGCWPNRAYFRGHAQLWFPRGNTQ